MYRGHIISQYKNMFDIADIYGERRGVGTFWIPDIMNFMRYKCLLNVQASSIRPLFYQIQSKSDRGIRGKEGYDEKLPQLGALGFFKLLLLSHKLRFFIGLEFGEVIFKGTINKRLFGR
jgi:hypothetical protein